MGTFSQEILITFHRLQIFGVIFTLEEQGIPQRFLFDENLFDIPPQVTTSSEHVHVAGNIEAMFGPGQSHAHPVFLCGETR